MKDPESISEAATGDVSKERDGETKPLLSDKSKLDVQSWNPASRLIKFIALLNDEFGYKLLVTLFCVQHLLKGFVNAFIGTALPYLYRAYKIPAPQVQIYSSVTSLPWDLKPIIGLVSDIKPLGGYNKAPYMLIASVGGAISMLVIGLTPAAALSVSGLVICIFMVNLQTSSCDLLSEAKYAEKMQGRPEHGPSLLTYVWFGLQAGSLVAILLSGPVIHSLGPKIPYIISALPALLVLAPLAMGYLEEKKQSTEDVSAARARYYRQREACMLCFIMLACSIALACCGLFSQDPKQNAICALIVFVVVITGFSLVLTPTIAKFNAFTLIQGAFSLRISGASFYFYTDTPEQYPEGPHFSEFFYNSVMGTLGSVVSLIGLYCYNRYMTGWKYRHLLMLTNIVASILAGVDCLMFARINVKLGIPDHVLVLGLSVFETLISQWQWMPQIIILSYLCPKGMEATMYALLAGCANLGGTVSSNWGALLLDRLGCKPSGAQGESAQFENLWIAAALATVLPLLVILVLFRLIPDAHQNERLVGDGVAEAQSATAGSLLRKLIGEEADSETSTTDSEEGSTSVQSTTPARQS